MSSLCNSKGWTQTIDYDFLSKIQTEPMGSRHVPANHGMVLDTFRNVLENNGVKPVKTSGILSPDHLRYIHMVEVADKQIPDFNFTFGFINYNNKQRSLTMFAGERVFICNNGMVSGILDTTKRKHTMGLVDEIVERFNGGFEQFHQFRAERILEVDRMKGFQVKDTQFGQFILHLHRESCIGNTNITRVVQEWDRPSFQYENVPDQRNAWNLQNACTYVFDHNVENPLQRIELNKEIRGYIGEVMAA